MTSAIVNTLKFSESGVRGVVGAGLTPRLITELAAAFGLYCGGGRIAVGRDTRQTGEMFECAVIAGLLSAGCQVIRLGVVPTPTIQFTVRHLECSGGIAVSASHNPEQWNALKFIGKSGCFLGPGEAGELFDLYSQGNLPCREERELREVRNYADAFAAHRERIFNALDRDAVRKRHFRVAVDCCNGVGAYYSADFLRELGCEVFPLFDETDGVFRRRPEPLPENLSELARIVRENRCDVGFAQDPDGDRLTLVTDLGEALNPDYTVALAVEQLLDAGDPGPVVVNTQTSRLVEYIAELRGCEVIHARVGEINVLEKMMECDSFVGGEGNCGGVIARRIHPGRDSYTGMSLILELLSFTGQSLHEIVGELPPVCNLSSRFPASPTEGKRLLEFFERKYHDLSPVAFDGLRIEFPEGRVFMRSSNTEPILRLNVECSDKADAEALRTRFEAEMKAFLASAEPTETIPPDAGTPPPVTR